MPSDSPGSGSKPWQIYALAGVAALAALLMFGLGLMTASLYLRAQALGLPDRQYQPDEAARLIRAERKDGEILLTLEAEDGGRYVLKPFAPRSR